MTVSVKAPTSTTGSIQLNGSDVLTIDSSGNLTAPNNLTVTGTVTQTGNATFNGDVGIGTSSPSTKFHVSDTSTSTVKSRTQASTGYVDIGMGGNSGVFDTSASDGIRLRLSGNDAVAIDSSSNFKLNSGYGSVATAYGCRAWVNFNGTGTVAIRDSGNVSSITDSGVGDYRINFSTAMPDTDYAVVGSCQGVSGSDIVDFGSFGYGGSPIVTPTTSQVAVGAFAYSGASVDTAIVSVAVFR